MSRLIDFDAALHLRNAARPEPEASNWRLRALCAETDPEEFFQTKGGSTKAAKAICRACEVSGPCLEFALATDQEFGVWAGTTRNQRRAIKRQRLEAAA